MSNQTLIQASHAGFTHVTELLVIVRDKAKAQRGDLTTLNTTEKASLVGALNELKSIIDNQSSIDDSNTGNDNTWSSSKISTEITKAINALIGGAGADSDSLQELANQITALAQADNGLLSFAQAQNLNQTQKQQAQDNINVYSKDKIGDIESADFVATINAVFNR